MDDFWRFCGGFPLFRTPLRRKVETAMYRRPRRRLPGGVLVTRKRLTARDMRIKGLLLSGYSRNAVASELRMASSSVYKAVQRLEDYGELQWVEGTISPAIYIDPKDPRYQSPKGDCPQKSGNRGGPATDEVQPSTVRDPPQTPENASDMPAVSVARECPEGYAAPHLSGQISLTVEKVGTFEPLRFGDDIVGEWRSEWSELNGSKQLMGQIDLFGQQMKFHYRRGLKSGRDYFYFFPERAFVDVNRMARNRISEIFKKRAEAVAAILGRNGWVLKDPVISGEIHLAWPDHQATRFVNRRIHIDGADVVTDNSPGYVELEMEHFGETDEDWAKARAIANFPTMLVAHDKAIGELREGDDSLSARLGSVEGLTARIVGVLEHHSDMIHRTASVFEDQARINVCQAEINASALARSQEHRFQTDSDGPQVPSNIPEGYH